MKNHLKLAASFLCLCALLGFAASRLQAEGGGYSFKVHNGTDQAITKLLASEDGETYGNFDIGAGIEAGKTITLVWDKSTDGGKCNWWFKATFADGDDSEAKKFDFCEKDLELEF